ncbi:MAG: ABC transporter permease, partial [Bryobacteraceae bacterium]
VVMAIVLRDMHSRFGRTFFGTLLIIAWPLSHLMILMIAFLVTRKIIPIGTDPAVFVGTGALPYILFFYPGRMILFSIVQNKSLLGLPPVEPTDLIIARCIVEINAAFWVTALFGLILYLFGVNPLPHRPVDAIMAILATIYLGFAIGFFGAVMYGLFRAWVAFQFLGLIGMYLSSGVFFVPTSLPEKLRNLIWFNPLMHSVEWLRSAYFDSYGYGMLNVGYLLGYATVTLFLALVIERATRGRLMMEH